MKKMMKHLYAILLVVVLVATLLPTSVFAGPGKGHGRGKNKQEKNTEVVVETEPTGTPIEEDILNETVQEETPAPQVSVEEDETIEEIEQIEDNQESPVEDSVDESAINEDFADKVTEETWNPLNATLEVGDLVVTVDAPENTFPTGTIVNAEIVNNAVAQAAVNATDAVNGTVVAAVDITFTYNGDEVQPANNQNVNVSIKAKDIVTEAETIDVVHIDNVTSEAETVKNVDVDPVEEVVTFDAASFSVYAIIRIDVPVEPGFYAASDNGVAVSVETQEGTFAEPVELVVEKITDDSEAYAVAEEELEKIGHTYEGMVAFDIHFENKTTGAEVEPNVPVDVQLSITDAELAGVPEEAVGNVTIAHVFDEGGAEIVSEPSYGEAVGEVDETEEFTAEVFSTYTISWGDWWDPYSYNIHYVDTNGASLTPSRTPEFSNGYNFLIYDIDGYEYDSTHLTSRTGTAIKPLLGYFDDEYYLDNNNNWKKLRNDIYVVYKEKAAPTTGGTPVVDEDEEWPEGKNAPQFSKSSVHNDNGTNTISLSIVAAEKPVEKSNPADVIVVFDRSGSMGDSMSGQTRLQRAKNAVNTMANTLLSANSGVRMALVSFSTDAELTQGFTSNYTTFSGKVNGLSANGGTNWEKALEIANHLDVRSDAATFIVFVTDGDPTFRISRGDVSDNDLDMYTGSTYQYYRNNVIFGTGSSDNNGRNFDFAVDQVSAIDGANKNFYAIGISTDVTKVKNLTTEGGVDGSHAFIASDSAAMEEAFKSITESIKSALGFGDVAITDGITALTNAEMKVMETVDPDSFQYYRWGGEGNKYGPDEAHKTEWTTREADGCAAATYSETDGAVHWNMGETFQLENGVHYVVTFRVWPSQEAYDLVADLNNGIKTYDSLTAEEKAQVVKLDTEPPTYALKTNTDNVNATYSQTTKTGDVVTISGEQDIEADYHPGTMDNMALESMKLTIKKEFEDDLTAGEDRESEVTLVLKRRNAHQTPDAEFVDYPVPQQGGTTSANIVLNEANNWTYTLYVAPGFEVDGEVLEHGYDFTITEPDIDYHYGLIEEIINPMVVNGEDKYYGDGELIDGETVPKYTDRSLTAVNRVKSGIDIKKVVVDPDGNEIQPQDVEFTITGKILDADGNPFTWNEGDSVDASGAYHKYDKDGNRIVYKGHFPTTANIEFTLKAGEYVRFINVPDGCTFEFDEKSDTMPAGYKWNKSEGVTQHRTGPGEDFTPEGDVQPVVEQGKSKVSLATGVVGNKQYSVTFTNTSEKGESFYVYHSSDNTIEKIYTEDARVAKGAYDAQKKTYNYTFSMVNETKTGYLYGGYFTAYGGQVLSSAEIVELKYDKTGSSGGVYADAVTNGVWDVDAKGCKPYTGSAAAAWRNANAYKTEADKGTAMKPVMNTVYYLKEVPKEYISPYIYYVYDEYSANHDLKQLYMITDTDDKNYNEVGIQCQKTTDDKKTTTLYASIRVNKAGQSTVYETLTAKNLCTKITAFGSVPRGYLAYWQTNALIQNNAEYKMLPYWKTLDGVTVTGISNRTVSIGNATYGTGGLSVSQDPVDSTAK